MRGIRRIFRFLAKFGFAFSELGANGLKFCKKRFRLSGPFAQFCFDLLVAFVGHL